MSESENNVTTLEGGMTIEVVDNCLKMQAFDFTTNYHNTIYAFDKDREGYHLLPAGINISEIYKILGMYMHFVENTKFKENCVFAIPYGNCEVNPEAGEFKITIYDSENKPHWYHGKLRTYHKFAGGEYIDVAGFLGPMICEKYKDGQAIYRSPYIGYSAESAIQIIRENDRSLFARFKKRMGW